ncbi:hypothetical protein, partial [Neokomagataea anthophila]
MSISCFLQSGGFGKHRKVEESFRCSFCEYAGCWFFESVNRLVHHLRVPFSGWSDPLYLWCNAKR